MRQDEGRLSSDGEGDAIAGGGREEGGGGSECYPGRCTGERGGAPGDDGGEGRRKKHEHLLGRFVSGMGMSGKKPQSQLQPENTNMTETVAAKRKITDFFRVSKKPKREAKVQVEVKTTTDQAAGASAAVSAAVSTVVSTPAFDKTKFIASLTSEQRYLLELELTTMEDSWLELLHTELTKPYFLDLKRFLLKEWAGSVPIFPPRDDVYAWTRLTPLRAVRVLVIGQDPYHNYNQAHGLAFSVRDRHTRVPPSLVNIFKGLRNDYPDFVPPAHGDLTPWAREGVLLLNTCLTVQAHRANSHAKRGWEHFTAAVVRELVRASERAGRGLVLIAWGRPAQQLVARLDLGLAPATSPRGASSASTKDTSRPLLYLCGAHPSPLSATRGGFFTNGHFRRCNEWLREHGRGEIVWQL